MEIIKMYLKAKSCVLINGGLANFISLRRTPDSSNAFSIYFFYLNYYF